MNYAWGHKEYWRLKGKCQEYEEWNGIKGKKGFMEVPAKAHFESNAFRWLKPPFMLSFLIFHWLFHFIFFFTVQAFFRLKLIPVYPLSIFASASSSRLSSFFPFRPKRSKMESRSVKAHFVFSLLSSFIPLNFIFKHCSIIAVAG